MTSTFCPSWLAVSASTQALLVAATQSWEETQAASQYIQAALAQPDVELDVLVSAYRYYFYKNNNDEALAVTAQILNRIQVAEQWPETWEVLKPILVTNLGEPIVRLYLNAYAASGLLLARLGQVESANTIAAQVQQIGAKEFGADVLLNILNPAPEDEEE